MDRKSPFIMLWIAAALFAAGCGSSKDTTVPSQPDAAAADSPDTQYVASDAKGVQTIVVSPTTIPDYLDLPAHIEPDPTSVVHVFAPAGGRIVEMKVRPWDHVATGQTLATLESSELARAVADYHKAVADDQVKQKQMARSQDLLDHHATSERENQQAQSDAEQAKAELEAAREQVQVFNMDPDHASTQLVIKAPRAGVVLDVGGASGEFSQALSAPAPLCTIADISSVWAVGDVYEKDLGATKTGEKAEVTLNAYPDQHWAGQVGVVSDAVDPATRMLHVRVVLPNADGRIKPGLFGAIRLLRSSAQGILVPPDAVIREGDSAYIFVSSGNGRYVRRDVKLGRSVDGTLEIVSGLNAGETIVSEGALLLRPAGQG